MVKSIDYNIQQAWETTCMCTMITNFPKESCYESACILYYNICRLMLWKKRTNY